MSRYLLFGSGMSIATVILSFLTFAVQNPDNRSLQAFVETVINIISKEVTLKDMQTNMYWWIDSELQEKTMTDKSHDNISMDLRKESMSMMNDFSDYMMTISSNKTGIETSIDTLELPSIIKSNLKETIRTQDVWIRHKRNAVFGPIVSGDDGSDTKETGKCKHNVANPAYVGGYGYNYYVHFEKVNENKFIMLIMVSGYVYELDNECKEVETTETIHKTKEHKGWFSTTYEHDKTQIDGKRVVCKPKEVTMEAWENLLNLRFNHLMKSVKKILGAALRITTNNKT